MMGLVVMKGGEAAELVRSSSVMKRRLFNMALREMQ